MQLFAVLKVTTEFSMLYSPDLCGPKNYFSRKIAGESIRLVVVLSLLGVPAVAKASTQAMATVEFFQGSTLEATIDIVSVLPGVQGNGLQIAFASGAFGAGGPSVNAIGNAETGFSVLMTIENGPIAYEDITVAVDMIPVVSATLRSSLYGTSFDPFLQDAPPIAFLSGGRDAVVPEPSGALLTAIFCGMSGAKRRR